MIAIRINCTSFKTYNRVSQSFSNYLNNPPSGFNQIGKHFASIIDLNSDCFADLILLSQDPNNSDNTIIETYLKDKNSLYNMQTSFTLKKIVTWMAFTDINGDGSTDFIYTTQEKGANKIYVVFNSNRANDICSINSNKPYNYSAAQEIILPNGYFLTNNSHLKFGDVNFDGFPDMLAIFNKNEFTVPSILVNTISTNNNLSIFSPMDAAS